MRKFWMIFKRKINKSCLGLKTWNTLESKKIIDRKYTEEVKF